MLATISAKAQTIHSIVDGDFTGCAGAIVDSGGEGGPGYGNNEDLTATICPDIPGEGISLSFVIGNLNATGAAPFDVLTIHDGNTTGAPVLGTFSGTTLQGQIIFASPANTSGCLTIHFTSNAVGTGAFAASISCFTPCIPPTAVATMSEPAPAKICPGEALVFDCTASYAEPGFNIVQRTWDFDDGTTVEGTVVSHTFDEVGDYLVQLTLVDDNGCTNTNLIDLQVLVGTTPVFVGTTQSTSMCEGGTFDLQGVVTPVTWTGIPEVDFGDGVELPDNVGETFSSTIENTYFSPGATLTDVDDLLSICVDMEHSFMGDLAITINCPNGQGVVLHQQNGGGTYLGGADDNDEGNPQPGTCWNYCWSPNATNGTWVEAVDDGLTGPSGTGGTALQEGTYSSVGNMNALLGCPLNGTWTFSITDLWGADNGFLCSWEMDFDPSLYPDLVQFTPVPGTTSDSIFWSGPGVVNDPNNPGAATASTTEPGTVDYTLSVIDDFGCTYDTTITFTITNAPQVGATATLGATCNDPAMLEAEIVAYPPPSSTCTYRLELNDSFGNGWNAGAALNVSIDGGSSNYVLGNGYTAIFNLNVETGETIVLNYIAGTAWNADNSFTLYDNAGNAVYTSPNGPPTGIVWSGIADCGPGTGPLIYTWSPAGSVQDPISPTTTAQVTEPTEIVVLVHPSNQPWCSTTDTVFVIPPSFLENDSVIVNANCFGEDGTITVISTGPSGPWNYQWVNEQGTVVATTTAANGDVFTGPAGTYSVNVSEGPLGNGCLDTLEATITEPLLLEWVTLPMDTLICITGNAALAAEAQGGTGTITLEWEPGLAGNGPHTISPATTTDYTVQAVDANGCTTTEETVTVAVNLPLSFIPLEPDTECFGIPVPFAALDASGGDGEYLFDWGAGPQPLNSFFAELPVTGTVCVTLSDGCETPQFTSCVELEILQTPPLVLTADTVLGCAPFSVRFDVQDTTGLAVVDWDFGNAILINDSANVTNLYPIGGNFSVGVVVEWPNGCITDTSITDMVRVLTQPNAHLDWNPHPPSIINPIVQFTDLSVPNVVSWNWDFGDLGTSTEQHPVVEFPTEAGDVYPVELVVANALGCTDTVRTLVEVLDELLIFVPNAFTPNGEGQNEVFEVMGNDISTEDYQLIVFDRWGKEVFNTTDRYQGWDGTLGGAGGDVLPQSVYVYKLKVISLSSRRKKEVMGHVTLLR